MVESACMREPNAKLATISFATFLTKDKKDCTVRDMTNHIDSPPARPISVALSLTTRLRLQAIETILQQSTSVVLQRAIEDFIEHLPDHDRALIKALTTRALNSLQKRADDDTPREESTGRTVNGKPFRYRGSIDDGLEILFENSQPLRITKASIDKIREEIADRKGPALMGAIFSPLMPDSIGEAIQTKHKLTPINLSYVVPLLQEQRLVNAFKEGRNWYIAATSLVRASEA